MLLLAWFIFAVALIGLLFLGFSATNLVAAAVTFDAIILIVAFVAALIIGIAAIVTFIKSRGLGATALAVFGLPIVLAIVAVAFIMMGSENGFAIFDLGSFIAGFIS